MKRLLAILMALMVGLGSVISAPRAVPAQAGSGDVPVLPDWLVSVGSEAEPTPAPTPGSRDGSAVDKVRLGAQDDGGRVTLTENQVLVVSLEANPSTGYFWEV